MASDIQALLAQVGVPDVRLSASEAEVFDAPSSPIGEGKRFAPTVILAAQVFSATPPPVHLLPLRPARLEQSGLQFYRVQEAPHLVQVSSADDELIVGAESPDAIFRVTDR